MDQALRRILEGLLEELATAKTMADVNNAAARTIHELAFADTEPDE